MGLCVQDPLRPEFCWCLSTRHDRAAGGKPIRFILIGHVMLLTDFIRPAARPLFYCKSCATGTASIQLREHAMMQSIGHEVTPFTVQVPGARIC